jgi:hypothetical protein
MEDTYTTEIDLGEIKDLLEYKIDKLYEKELTDFDSGLLFAYKEILNMLEGK